MNLTQSGAAANFLICVAVVIFGFYPLRKLDREFDRQWRFLFRAFLCWWLAWVAWSVTWAVILSKLQLAPVTKNILTLVGSDLHAILLILVYFFLTRGSTYKPSQALIEGIFLALILLVGYSALYITFAPETASRLQEEWGLILGAVSTILVGWGFLLRYNTRIVLVMGFIYGFAQPAAFESVLIGKNPLPDATRVAIHIIIAGLKILWATSVTLCILQLPNSSDTLVQASTSRFGFDRLRTQIVFMCVQSLALLSIFLVFLMGLTPKEYLHEIFEGMKVLASACAIILFIIGILDRIKSRGAATETSATRERDSH